VHYFALEETPMAWPLSQDYNEAIQDPETGFADAELKQGHAATNALGIPMPRSGNFADVYEVTTPRGKWAVKCFTRQIPGLRERYREVSAYLKQAPLPFMVEFTYLEQGIRVRSDWYPVLKMNWVEGFNLNQFVKDNLAKPQLLGVLGQIWSKLAAKLTEAQMAHCDLQHGNVLLVPGSKTGSLAVKLVDYDGMCVPALTLLKSIEVGHPNFQHPQRAKQGIYNLQVDRFSHLVIYTAARALQVEGRPLWDRYDNGDNLLFKAADFENPQRSPLFAELLKSGDAGVRQLTETMLQALSQSLEDTPLLRDVTAGLPEVARSTALTRTVPVPPPVAASAETFVGVDASEPPQVHAPAHSQGGAWMGIVAAVVLLGVIGLAGAGAAAYFLLGKSTPAPAVARQQPQEPREPLKKVEVPRKNVDPVKKVEPRVPDPMEKKKDPAPNVEIKPDPEPKPEKPPVIPDKPAVPPDPTRLSEIRRFTGHGDWVMAVAFSPDGRRAASGSGYPSNKNDNTARLWDIESGKEIRAFRGHTLPIEGVAFTPDGRQLLTASHDYTLRLWDVETGDPVRTFAGHKLWIKCVALSRDGLLAISGADDKTARLWDVDSGKEIGRLDHEKSVLAVAFSPDGRQFLTGGHENILRLWDVKTQKEVRRFLGHTGSIRSAVFSADGRRALTGSLDKTVRLWDVSNGKEIRRFEGHSGEVHGVAFTPDGRSILSASVDGTLRLWDADSGKELSRFDGRKDSILALAVSANGQFALTGCVDRTLSLWRLPESKPPKVAVVPEPEPEPANKPSKAGSAILRLKGGNSRVELADTVGLVDLKGDFTGEMWARINSPNRVQRFMGDHVRRINQNPRLIAGWDFAAQFFDGTSGRLIANVGGGERDAGSIAGGGFSVRPEWHHVAFVKSKNRAHSFVDGKEIWSFDVFGEPVASPVALSLGSAAEADRRQGEFNGDIRAFRLSSKARYQGPFAPPKRFTKDSGTVILLDFSGKGDRLLDLVGKHDGKIIDCEWVAADAPEAGPAGPKLEFRDNPTADLYLPKPTQVTGEIHRLVGQGGPCSAVFSQDGKRALSCGTDKEMVLWDLETGKEIRRFQGHDIELSTCALSPDGRRALSGGGQGNDVCLWDVESGKVLRRIKTAFTARVAFSPDGKRILIGGGAGTLSLHDLNGTSLRTTSAGKGMVTSMAFGRDGRTISALTWQGDALIWNSATNARVAQLQTLPSCSGGAFIAGGKQLVFRSKARDQGGIYVRDVKTGAEVLRFGDGAPFAGGVAVSPNGRYVLASSDRGAIRMYDTSTGGQVAVFDGHKGPIQSIAFAPKGRYAISAGMDGTVRVWELPDLEGNPDK
jgi:WD40 repeat protein